MLSTDIKTALALLKEARALLKKSEVANLRKSAEYLEASLQVLTQKAH